MDELDNISLGLQPETWLEPMPDMDRFRFLISALVFEPEHYPRFLEACIPDSYQRLEQNG